jgi:hypothetical protein
MSFLTLPRELRNQVYEYITNLNTHPFKSYSGFYLSCRRVKQEVDHEGAKVLARCIVELKSSFAAERGSSSTRTKYPPHSKTCAAWTSH